MNKKGFTLVEMLLVITLIAAITAIIIPNITGGITTSKDEKYRSYVTLLEDNLEMYNLDTGYTGIVGIDNLKKHTSEINIEGCDPKKLEIKLNKTVYAEIECTDNGKTYVCHSMISNNKQNKPKCEVR